MTTEPGARTGSDNGSERSQFADDWRRAQAEAKSIGASIGEVTEEIRRLFRLEGELAAAEFSDSAAAARKAGMWGAVTGLFGFLTVIFLSLAGMFALSLVFELWASALITAGIMAVVAGIAMVLMRRQIKEANPVPKRTMQSIQEDMRWAREQMKRRNA